MSQQQYKTILAFAGAILNFFMPVVPILIIAALAILFDCWTAKRLSKRVKEKLNAGTGKFRSVKAKKIFDTLIKISCLLLLAYLIDYHIIRDSIDMWAVRAVAGAFVFVEIVSMLENESSLNEAKWAIIAQRILVSKVERHFDIDLPEYHTK
ncbi:MAG: hypothetical protein Q8861_01890 [Bacteroidota bacterium]|nr:hypothetical protein [Bacteroidota bacterium]